MASPFLLFIMAGGSGERFWPLSRKAKPKHLLRLVSSKTLLEETVLRLKPLTKKPSDLLILTNHEQVPGLRKALPRFPKASLIPEPAKRDTAPAAALATALALRSHPEAILALLPADAVIGKHPVFRAQLAAAARAAAASWARKTGCLPITASAGRRARIASGWLLRARAVARAAAGAVSRLAGSGMREALGKRGRAFRRPGTCSWLVRISKSEGFLVNGFKRRTVSSSRVFEETRRRRCLGLALRLRGQNRSPDPPAMMKSRNGEAIS